MGKPKTRGERIRQLRATRGLTQRQVAEQLDTDTACISNWELDRHAPNLESVAALAGALGCSIDYLVTGRESRHAAGIDD